MTALSDDEPRFDFDIYNESCALFISNAKLKETYLDSDEDLPKAVEDRNLIAVELDQDDGFIARVVLGALSSKEKSEWIGRGSRKLNIEDGQLVVSGGAAYLSEDLDEEYFEILEVPPGEYFVTVYQHMPFINGFRLTHLPDWEGFVPYYRETRSATKRLPDWLAEFADLEGEELDEASADYEEDDEKVAFVIQLLPVGPRQKESELEEDSFLSTELRIPKKCPLGIEPEGIEREDEMSDEQLAELEAAEQKAHEERFSDKDDLASQFRGFGDAIQTKNFRAIAPFFVTALKDQVNDYVESEIERAREDSAGMQTLELTMEQMTGEAELPEEELPEVPELNSIWRDGEPFETTAPRWQSSSEQGNNLLSESDFTADTYLGEIRCEFGSSEKYIAGEIPMYLMVDLLVIETPDGPRATGVCVY